MQDFSSEEQANLERLSLLGLSPQQAFHDLNLAGSQGVPTPRQITHPRRPISYHKPAYGKPDMRVPDLQRTDLSTPDLTIHAANASDPTLPENDDAMPYSLDIIDTPPENLFAMHDDLLPATQPTLEPVSMAELPTEMVPDTQALLASLPMEQLVADKSYPAVQMDQQGYNAALARHLTLLLSGLRDED